MFTRHSKNSATILDYVVVSAEDEKAVKRLFIDEAGVLGGSSDHVFMITSLDTGYGAMPPIVKAPKTTPTWLMDGDWDKYKVKTDEALDEINQESMKDEDEYGKAIVVAMVTGLEQGIGKKERGADKKEYPVKVRKVLQARRQARAEWRGANSALMKNATEENKVRLAKAECEKDGWDERVEAVMAKFWTMKRERVLEDLAEKSAKSNKLFWKHVVDSKLNKTGFSRLEDPVSGEMVEEQPDLKRVVENFLKGLFQGEFSPMEGRKVTEEDIKGAGEQVPEVEAGLEEAFTVTEIEAIIKMLNNGKAMGVDGVPAEAIKNGSPKLVGHLVKLFNMIKESGKVPDCWKTGRVVLVPKPGAATDMGNYRPLTVITAVSALFSKVLNARLTTVVEGRNLLGELQQGFRKGRSGADNTFVLNTILMMCAAKKKKPHLAFIDIKKVLNGIDSD
jgi:hypothetical protein